MIFNEVSPEKFGVFLLDFLFVYYIGFPLYYEQKRKVIFYITIAVSQRR